MPFKCRNKTFSKDILKIIRALIRLFKNLLSRGDMNKDCKNVVEHDGVHSQ